MTTRGKLVPDCQTILDFFLRQQTTESAAVVTTGTPRRAKIQSNHRHQLHTVSALEALRNALY